MANDKKQGNPLEHSGQSRRSFLRGAAGGLVAAPLLASTAAAEVIRQQGVQPGGSVLPDRAVGRPMPRRAQLPETPPEWADDGRSIGYAVVGLGSFALGQVMPALTKTKRSHLAAVVSGNPEKAARVASAYGLPEDAIYSYDNYDEIANDDRIDAVYIVLPTGLHAEYTVLAFKAGKHVMCEKPMAGTPEECQAMIDAANEAGKKLMIAYRVHFEPINMAVRDAIAGGEIGMPRMLQTTNHRVMNLSNVSDVWRADKSLAGGGGALPDYGLYGLNGMVYFLDETPSEIYAKITTPENDPRFADIEDHVSAQLYFPSGAMGNLSTSYNTANSNTIGVWGDDGKVWMDPATFYGGIQATLTAGGGNRQITGDSGLQFEREIDHLSAAALDGSEIITPGEMGLRDTRLIQAIYTSAREGRPVQLNPDATMVG